MHTYTQRVHTCVCMERNFTYVCTPMREKKYGKILTIDEPR